LTSTHLDKEIFIEGKDNKYNGMTEEELKSKQIWTLQELQEYLLRNRSKGCILFN